MSRKAPPTTDPNRIVSVEAEPFSLPNIDVRLFRYTHRNAAGDEVRPAAVPTVDPSYQFREDAVREFAWAVWPHDQPDPLTTDKWAPCCISGPKGSGKTSFVTQMAARCNVPVFRANMNVGTTVRHLKGRVGAQEGRTVYVPGICTMAMEAPAGWLLLDEISATTPPVAMALFPIFEPDGAVLLEDAQPPRYARRSPHFRLFCTDNTLGNAQEESRFDYSGTDADQNVALLDRVRSFIEMGYPDFETEHAIVAGAVPTIDGMVLHGLLHVANEVRNNATIAGGFSVRMTLDWARRCAAGVIKADGTTVPYTEIFDSDEWLVKTADDAFGKRLSSRVDRDTVTEVIRRCFGDTDG